MFAEIKSEFRKLVSVRSTYVIVGLTVLLLALFSFYIEGVRVTQAAALNPHLLADGARQAILSVGLLGSLVGVLMVTHEYRYNTIMYTLSASNSRTKALLAKFLVVSAYSLVFSAMVLLLSLVLAMAGVHVAGVTLIGQQVPFGSLIWQVLFVGWGYAVFAFVLAAIIRVQAGAIAAMFLVPAMVESLLSLLLKKNAIYLPYTALQSIVQPNSELGHLSTAHTIAVVMLYIAVGLAVTRQLFVSRDAN